MIARKDILSIPFLKKSVFTGSFEGMRYRLEKCEAEKETLLVTVWDAPYCYEATSEEQKERCECSFSEEGICEAVDWLNKMWNTQEERWKAAQNSW